MCLQYSATPSQQINTSNHLQDTYFSFWISWILVGFSYWISALNQFDVELHFGPMRFHRGQGFRQEPQLMFLLFSPTQLEEVNYYGN